MHGGRGGATCAEKQDIRQRSPRDAVCPMAGDVPPCAPPAAAAACRHQCTGPTAVPCRTPVLSRPETSTSVSKTIGGAGERQPCDIPSCSLGLSARQAQAAGRAQNARFQTVGCLVGGDRNEVWWLSSDRKRWERAALAGTPCKADEPDFPPSAPLRRQSPSISLLHNAAPPQDSPR